MLILALLLFSGHIPSLFPSTLTIIPTNRFSSLIFPFRPTLSFSCLHFNIFQPLHFLAYHFFLSYTFTFFPTLSCFYLPKLNTLLSYLLSLHHTLCPYILYSFLPFIAAIFPTSKSLTYHSLLGISPSLRPSHLIFINPSEVKSIPSKTNKRYYFPPSPPHSSVSYCFLKQSP